MQITLHVTNGPETGKHASIRYGETLLVGRASECGLSLPGDEELSRAHFSVVSNLEGFALRDHNSANQTKLEDEAIVLTGLEDGDEIQAGKSTFRIELSPGDTTSEVTIDETARFKRPDGLPSKPSTGGAERRASATGVMLIVLGGPHKGEQHLIDAGHAAVVGRGEEATIQLLKDESMSRIHFSIDFTSELIQFRDLGSANGSEINKREVAAATLKNGDVILAGDSKFHIQFENNPAWVELDEGEGEMTGFRNLSDTMRIRRPGK